MVLLIEILKAVLFGIVEGITEWLPVSSTGHLIILEELVSFDFGEAVAPGFASEYWSMFEVVIQLGAILAVVVKFFRKLNPFSPVKSPLEKKSTWSLWAKVCIASIPAAFVGIVLDKVIEKLTSKDIDGWIYNWQVVAMALIVYGAVFIFIEKFRVSGEDKVSDVHEISYLQAALIGVFQMLAIVPGTSRSGSTILGSRLLGIARSAAAEFSFFLGIPAMAGASLIKAYGFFDYVLESGVSVPIEAWLYLAVAFAVAFVVSMLTIDFLMAFVKKHSFGAFGIYRIALGLLVITYFWLIK